MKKYHLLFVNGLIGVFDTKAAIPEEELQQLAKFSKQERLLLRQRYVLDPNAKTINEKDVWTNCKINAIKVGVDKLENILNIIKKESPQNNVYGNLLINTIEDGIQNICETTEKQKEIMQTIERLEKLVTPIKASDPFYVCFINKIKAITIDKIKPSIKYRLEQYSPTELELIQNHVKKHITLLREMYMRMYITKENPLQLQSELPEKKILLPILVLKMQELVTIKEVVYQELQTHNHPCKR